LTALYNECEPFAAAWLRELIKADLIAPGIVDERPIQELKPSDVEGFTQFHAFAGIGVWSFALRAAGWPDDRPVWTGSCPCQPFSAAGRRGGAADDRHLWPEWFRLIREHRPPVVFGEQVSSEDGLAWLDTVSSDVEGEAYAIGALDTCAAGVGAPHIRQRLYFVADAREGGRPVERETRVHADGQPGDDVARRGASDELADTDNIKRGPVRARHDEQRAGDDSNRRGAAGRLGDAGSDRDREYPRKLHGDEAEHEERRPDGHHPSVDTGPTRGFWAGAEWIPCRDGKLRPVEPGSFPLVAGAPARVGRLRGYGNALNAEQAKAFVEAYMDVRGAA
jgi:DNA (cytosine-5)-methyltransferase 1